MRGTSNGRYGLPLSYRLSAANLSSTRLRVVSERPASPSSESISSGSTFTIEKSPSSVSDLSMSSQIGGESKERSLSTVVIIALFLFCAQLIYFAGFGIFRRVTASLENAIPPTNALSPSVVTGSVEWVAKDSTKKHPYPQLGPALDSLPPSRQLQQNLRSSIRSPSILLITHEFSSISTAGGVGSAFYEKAKATARAGFDTHVLFLPSNIRFAPTRTRFAKLAESHANEGITLLPLRAYGDDSDISFDDPFAGGGYMPYARRSVQIGNYVCEEILPYQNYDIIIAPEVAGDIALISPSSCKAFEQHRPVLVVELHGPHVWWRQAQHKTHANLLVDLDAARLEMDSANYADFVVSPSQALLDFLMKDFLWRPTYLSSLTIPQQDNPSSIVPPPRVSIWPNIVQLNTPSTSLQHKGDQSHLHRGLRPGELRQLVFFGTINRIKGAHLVLDALTLMYGKDKSTVEREDVNVYPPSLSVIFLGRDGDPISTKIPSTCADLSRHISCKMLTNYTRNNAISLLSSSSALSRASSLKVSRVPPLVIVPSESLENSPTVVLEAQELGLPLIASATGGIPELFIQEQQSFLFEPTGPSIANTIKRIFSDGAPASTRRLAPDAVEEKWIEYLERLTEIGREVNKALTHHDTSDELPSYGVVLTTKSSLLETSLERIIISQDSFPEFIVVAVTVDDGRSHDDMEVIINDVCKAVNIIRPGTDGSRHCVVILSTSLDDFLFDKAINAHPLAPHMLIADGLGLPVSPNTISELRRMLLRVQDNEGDGEGSIPAVASPHVQTQGKIETYTGCGIRPSKAEKAHEHMVIDPLGLYINCYAYSSLFLITSSALSAFSLSSPREVMTFRTLKPIPLPVPIDSKTKWPMFASLAAQGYGFVSPLSSNATVAHSPTYIFDRHITNMQDASLDVLRNSVASILAGADSRRWSPTMLHTLSQSLGQDRSTFIEATTPDELKGHHTTQELVSDHKDTSKVPVLSDSTAKLSSPPDESLQFLCSKQSTCGSLASSSLTVPFYVYPTVQKKWGRLIDGLIQSRANASVIINYDSGNLHNVKMCQNKTLPPQHSIPSNPDWASLVDRIASHGLHDKVSLLGYVSTYRSLNESSQTPIVSKVAVRRAVRAIHSYADCFRVNGIFIDDVPSNTSLELQTIIAAAKQRRLKVFLNPGTFHADHVNYGVNGDSTEIVFDAETSGSSDGALTVLTEYANFLNESSSLIQARDRGIFIHSEDQKHLHGTIEQLKRMNVGHTYMTDVSYERGLPSYWEELVCAFAPPEVCLSTAPIMDHRLL